MRNQHAECAQCDASAEGRHQQTSVRAPGSTFVGCRPTWAARIVLIVKVRPSADGYGDSVTQAEEPRSARRAPRDWAVDALCFLLGIGFTALVFIDGTDQQIPTVTNTVDAALGLLASRRFVAAPALAGRRRGDRRTVRRLLVVALGVDGVGRAELLGVGRACCRAGRRRRSMPAPASRAPCTTLSPTPPQPMTSTEAPASTSAQRVTAPTPVGTQQPTSAACGHGISLRIGHQHLGRAHHLLGEGADARHLVDVLPVARQPLGAVEHAPARRVVVAVAEDRAADRAVEAAAALRAEREDDVVAGLDVGDARRRPPRRCRPPRGPAPSAAATSSRR